MQTLEPRQWLVWRRSLLGRYLVLILILCVLLLWYNSTYNVRDIDFKAIRVHGLFGAENLTGGNATTRGSYCYLFLWFFSFSLHWCHLIASYCTSQNSHHRHSRPPWTLGELQARLADTPLLCSDGEVRIHLHVSWGQHWGGKEETKLNSREPWRKGNYEDDQDSMRSSGCELKLCELNMQFIPFSTSSVATAS